MAIVGAILMLGAALLALGVAALSAWSGWRAFRNELLPGFRTVPPGPRSVVLVVLGVALPIVAIVAFTLYLAAVLVRQIFNVL